MKNEKESQITRTVFEWFWLLVIGSVLGFILEGIWCVFTKGHWENHSALIYGPFCVIYGVGMLFMYLVAKRYENKKMWIQSILFLIAGSLVEYFLSFLQELIFGSVSWDYSDRFMNINGRICLKMSLIWGTLGIVFAKFIYPHLNELLSKLFCPAVKAVTAVFFIFILANVLITVIAVDRWHMRSAGVNPETSFGIWVDEHYDDERMKSVFSNMTFVDSKK